MLSQEIDGERRENKAKKRELHELLYTTMVKSGTIRLATGFVLAPVPGLHGLLLFFSLIYGLQLVISSSPK